MAGVKGRSGGANARTVKQHKLAGTFRRDRHAGVRNPDPPEGIPQSPHPLRGEAAAEWSRMLERLSAQRTLSTVDGAALYRYVRLHALTERIGRAIDELDSLEFEKVSVDGAGVEHREPKAHPLIVQYRGCVMACRVYLAEFGLTPASRGRVRVTDPPADVDEFTQFEIPTSSRPS